MMIRVVTDSVASLPQDLVEDLNIDVVSLFVHHEGKEYDDATMDLDDFYSHIYEMVDTIPTSSQPSQDGFEEHRIDALLVHSREPHLLEEGRSHRWRCGAHRQSDAHLACSYR